MQILYAKYIVILEKDEETENTKERISTKWHDY